MRFQYCLIVVSILTLFSGTSSGQLGDSPDKSKIGKKISFQRDIRPILSDKCFACHGPDQKTVAAGLRLDIEKEAKADLDGYFAIKPGDAENSELVLRITSDDEDEIMPPPHTEKELSASEIQLLKDWINQGAPWAKHWAYERNKVKIPVIDDKRYRTWAVGNIDRLVLHHALQAGLQPSKAASPTTLIRRISFDLTGLPPTPEQVKTFVARPTDDAYEKLVDQLLASPHFGERMAIYWLDLVRYADTVGYHGDQVQNISPYRDWVIHAFNRNLPFDQFTREQLAGDLLPNRTESQLIATGYNRMLQTTHEGGLQPKEYRAIYAADRVRNFSAVWMGATVGCAQCHDHKYDPYTAKDFYAMSAFFADVDDEQHFKKGTNSNPTARPPEISVITELQKIRIKQLANKVKDLGAKVSAEKDSTRKQLLQNEIRAINAAIEKLKKTKVKTMVTASLKQPRTVRLLPRGNWLDESGVELQPAVPEFLGKLSKSDRPTRLDLANWLFEKNSDNAFYTSRVMANRIWYLLFGKGISQDLGDFGGQGKPPANPELLDYLAQRYIDLNWDTKALIKEILLSRAYQQSSFQSAKARELDPENQYFARQSQFRLSAEMIRDNALLVSGLLVDELGGPSAKPYQPAGYYRHLNFPPRKYQQHSDRQQWRRGVYVHWQRQFLHPTFKALDAPTREECTAERPRSNTPLAALSLMNDPTFVEAARAFAEKTLLEKFENVSAKPAGLDRLRIESAFYWCTSREPNKQEIAILTQYLRDARLRYAKQKSDAQKLISIGLSKPDQRLAVDELAAWTALCRVMLNLDETITRN